MKCIIGVISVIPIAFGTLIYVAFRNGDFLINDLLELILGVDGVFRMSAALHGMFNLSIVDINSLPSALWVFTASFLSTRSSFKSERVWYLWISLPLLYSVGLEGVQYCNITDGTFDIVDIQYSIIGWITAMIIAKLIDINVRGCLISYRYIGFLYLSLIFGNVW